MTDMMMAGVELMIIGMGIVFLFLAMLILAVNLMTAIVSHYFPEISTALPALNAGERDDSTVAAISAAVIRYRQDQQ